MLAHWSFVMLVQYYLVVPAQYYPTMLIQFCQAGAQLSGYDNIVVPQHNYLVTIMLYCVTGGAVWSRLRRRMNCVEALTELMLCRVGHYPDFESGITLIFSITHSLRFPHNSVAACTF